MLRATTVVFLGLLLSACVTTDQQLGGKSRKLQHAHAPPVMLGTGY